MPRRQTLETWRGRCIQRADKEGDDHIAEAEWNALISEVYGELFEIVTGTGLRYFESLHTITATGADSYDEPDDHGKTVGLDRVESDGRRTTLLPLMAQERSRYGGATGEAVAYAIVDNQIVFYPNPASGTYELIYNTQPPDISSYSDSDMIDVVCIYGEAYLLWGVAVKALSKGESDVRLAVAERDRAAMQLMKWASERDANEPRRRVLDTEYTDMFGRDPDWGR